MRRKFLRICPANDQLIGENTIKRTIRAEVVVDNRIMTGEELFYEVSILNKGSVNGSYSSLNLSQDMDHAVLGLLFLAMRKKLDIIVEGSVNIFLLENLEEFMHVWASWCPEVFFRVEIIPAVVSKSFTVDLDRNAVSAFSGGVDAAFTAYCNLYSKASLYSCSLNTLMLVQGFDIELDQNSAFNVVSSRCQKMLEDENVSLVKVRTNLKSFLPDWEQNHGAGLASCLHLLNNQHSIGLISSDEPYSHLVLPWGSNPLSNPLLSSGSMRIKPHGAGFTRTQKVEVLNGWEAARNYLRVCYMPPQTGRNCGKCEKCVRTMLNFMANNYPVPSCFPEGFSIEHLKAISSLNNIQTSYMIDILQTARKNNIKEPWVDEVSRIIKKNKSS